MTDDIHSQHTEFARLKRRAEFIFVRGGQHERRRAMVIQARRCRGSDDIRVGFTATKKIGNAVARNHAKRRLRAAASQLIGTFGRAGVDYVFIARKDTGDIAWQRLLDDMESALVSLADLLDRPDPRADAQ